MAIAETTMFVPKRDFVFVKENHGLVKIPFDSIVYVESCENYVVIHTKDIKKSIIRSTFSDFLAQLPPEKFCRAHRSYAIQTDLVDNIQYLELTILGQKVPIGKQYRGGLLIRLGIR